MADPLEELFGVSALSLFTGGRFVVEHGPLERLPAFMREGPMQSIDALCRSYTGGLQVANGNAREGVQIHVSEAHAAALLRLGLTVYFVDVQPTLPRSGAWLRELEGRLGVPNCASISAFVNAPGSGLPLHHDRFDQLFFQIRGQKRFRHAPNSYVKNPDVQFSPYTAAALGFGQTYQGGFPLTSEQLLEAERFETVELSPGTCFFMPAGTWHTTAEQTGDCLSLVVVVRAPSKLALLLNLLEVYGSQSEALRARTYGGFGVDESVRELEQQELGVLMSELARRMDSLPAEDAYAAYLASNYATGAQHEYPRHFRFERYIPLPNSKISFEMDETIGKLRCLVEAGPTDRPPLQTVLGFNPEARPVVDWLLSLGRAFSVSEASELFCEFAREDLEDLFGWLSQAGLIRPIPAPPWTVP
jgi:hypothetical protein